MNRRLANPFPAPSAPFWVGRGWTTRRRAVIGGDPNTDPAGGDGGDGAGGTDDDDDDDDEPGTPSGTEGTVSKEDYDKLLERMKGADRAKAAAEKKLQDIADKDKTALELAEQKVTKLTDENTKLAEENKRLKMENAFANVPDTQWSKPGAAFKLAIAEGYLEEILNEDGSVNTKAFNKKISEFAKAYPELVKKSEEGSGGSGTGTPPPASGAGVGSGGKGKGSGNLEDDVKKKYAHMLR